MIGSLPARKTVLLIFLFWWGTLPVARAQLTLDPVSISTAGTFATQSRGDDVIGLNPANLGYDDNPRFQLSFGLLPLVPFPAVLITNNALTPSWFNRRFLNQGFLDEAAVARLLQIFPEQGWEISPVIQLQLLGLSVGPYALAVAPEIYSRINLPKPLVRLFFEGIRFDKPIALDRLSSTVMALIPIGVAHGYEIDFVSLNYYVERSLIGMGVKLIGGGAYGRFELQEGTVLSQDSAFTVQGRGTMKSALGGVGLGFDVGLATEVTDHIRANVALNNLLGFVRWSGSRAYIREFELDAVIAAREVDKLRNYSGARLDSLWESYFVQDTLYAIDGFVTAYPAYLLAGLEVGQILPRWDLFLNYRQYFGTSFGHDYVPRLSVAAEYRPRERLRLRLGLAVGSRERFQWGIGLGYHRKRYHLDLGFSQFGGMFNYARGFIFSLEQKLVF
jgi:hypothetical protein